MIKILIVDDSRLFRERLKVFLVEYPEVSVVGEAWEGQAALIKARELKPDLVLMDVKMGDTNGLDVTMRLKGEFPDIKVIILSIYELEAYRKAAELAGASSYVTKKALVDALLPAIRLVMHIDQSE